MPVIQRLGASSLQRLQSLEKDCKDFVTQLSKLAEIIAASEWTFATLAPGTSADGRVDWALRWLLSKLRASDEDGVQARSSIEAWSLLSNIINRLQPSLTARALVSSRFLSIIETAAEEACHRQQDASLDEGLLDDDAGASDSERVSSLHESTVEQSAGSSKKRKRWVEADSSIAHKKRRIVENEKRSSLQNRYSSSNQTILDISRALDICLQNVVALASPARETLDSYARQYLQSTLKTDTAQAARLVGHWLTLRTLEVLSLQAEEQKDFSTDSLFAVLYVWNSSSTSEDTMTNSMLHFSKHCLMPALRYLWSCRQRRTSMAAVEGDGLNTSRVERLLAQYILIPNKARLRDEGSHTISDEASDNVDYTSLESLLSPLREHISSQDRNLFRGMYSVDVAVVPLLFEIAVRCYPISSRKKRMSTSQQIETVFISLATCLGFEADQTDLEKIPSSNVEAFEQLLLLASQRKVPFQSNYIENTAMKFLDPSLFSRGALQWPTIAHLVALDVNVFVPPRSATNAENSSNAITLHRRILTAITSQAWVPAGWSVQSTSEISAGSSLYKSYEFYVKIKDDVVIRLMNAYFAARDARGFLVRWREELAHFIKESLEESQSHNGVRRRCGFSVWQDHDLERNLAQTLATSFPPRHIVEVVEEFATSLELNTNQPLDISKVAQVTSSMHMLHALLHGLDDEKILRSVEGQIIQLFQLCVTLLETTQVEAQSMRSNAWRLLATCHRLLFSSGDLATIESCQTSYDSIMRQAVDTVGSASSSEQWENVDEGVQAVDCVGSINNNLRQRSLPEHQAVLSKYDLLVPFQRIFSHDNSSIDKTKALYFASVLSKYPELLSPKPNESVVQRKDRLLLIQALGQALLNSMDVEDSNLWQSFIQRSEDETKTIVEEISKAVSDMPKQSVSHENDKSAVFEEACFAIQPNLIPRSSRQQILDNAVAELSDRNAYRTTLRWSQTLSMMLRVLEVPSGSALVISSAESIWNVGMALDLLITLGQVDRGTSMSLLMLFHELANVILQYHISNKNAKSSQHYLGEIYGTFETLLKEKPLLHEQPSLLGLCVLTCDIFPSSGGAQKPTLGIDGSAVDKLCTRLCLELNDQLEDTFPGVIISAPASYTNTVLLDAVSKLQPSVLLRNKTVTAHTIKSWTSKVLHPNYLSDEAGDLAIAALAFKCSCNLNAAKSLQPSVSEALELSQSGLSVSDREIVHQAFIDNVHALNVATKEEIITSLLVVEGTQETTTVKLEVLHAFVTASTQKRYANLIPATSIPIITIKLSEQLPQSPTSSTFHHRSAILTSLLLRHPKPHSQLSIESVLLAITTTSSPSGPPLTKRHAPRIFTALTRILQALLTHHRRALRNRFDILLPALQSLLRCLFVPAPHPSAPTSAPTLRQMLPPWAPTTMATALGPTHASLYTRLLTTLCDPTLASVRSTSRGSASANLTDVTKKAREYAGQYAPLVLVEMARCMLVGRLGGDGAVRERLLQGVWAVFAVTEREVLEVVVEGLPAGERAVVRGLREEWRRVGGGKVGVRG